MKGVKSFMKVKETEISLKWNEWKELFEAEPRLIEVRGSVPTDGFVLTYRKDYDAEFRDFLKALLWAGPTRGGNMMMRPMAMVYSADIRECEKKIDEYAFEDKGRYVVVVTQMHRDCCYDDFEIEIIGADEAADVIRKEIAKFEQTYGVAFEI